MGKLSVKQSKKKSSNHQRRIVAKWSRSKKYDEKRTGKKLAKVEQVKEMLKEQKSAPANEPSDDAPVTNAADIVTDLVIENSPEVTGADSEAMEADATTGAAEVPDKASDGEEEDDGPKGTFPMVSDARIKSEIGNKKDIRKMQKRTKRVKRRKPWKGR